MMHLTISRRRSAHKQLRVPTGYFMKNWLQLLCVLSSFFLAFVVWSAHSVFMLGNEAIYGENGPLEALQALILAISCIVFIVPVALKKERDKLILLFCSLLCVSFVLRELDVERLDVHSAVKFLGSGVGRNTMLTVAFMALFAYAAFNFSYYKKESITFLKSKPGVLLMLGGLFLWVGNLFEKRYSIMNNVFFEEILELCGYYFILLSAFAANFSADRLRRH